MNIKDFKWTREPDDYTLTDDKIEIITQPGTDLWQRTYYHFRNDNAPVLQIETEEKFFSFMVKTDFKESHHRFDQCGVVMYLDSENWLKGSIEYENDNFQHLGSVVTNNGYSDWATTEIDAEIKSMWYRLSRREDDYCIECSEDGIRFKQIQIEISPVLRDLITVIFCYQILRNPLKTLDLSQVSFPLLFPLCYIFPYKFTNSDKGKYKGKKI